MLIHILFGYYLQLCRCTVKYCIKHLTVIHNPVVNITKKLVSIMDDAAVQYTLITSDATKTHQLLF